MFKAFGASSSIWKKTQTWHLESICSPLNSLNLDNQRSQELVCHWPWLGSPKPITTTETIAVPFIIFSVILSDFNPGELQAQKTSSTFVFQKKKKYFFTRIRLFVCFNCFLLSTILKVTKLNMNTSPPHYIWSFGILIPWNINSGRSEWQPSLRCLDSVWSPFINTHTKI